MIEKARVGISRPVPSTARPPIHEFIGAGPRAPSRRIELGLLIGNVLGSPFFVGGA
jgi:hypothetical protein